MATKSDCLFCKIVNQELPADVVYEDDELLAFNDISPQLVQSFCDHEFLGGVQLAPHVGNVKSLSGSPRAADPGCNCFRFSP